MTRPADPLALFRVHVAEPVVTFSVRGPVVPYVRVGRERWTDRARRYLAWQDAFRWELIAQLPTTAPLYAEGDVAVALGFFRGARRCDADNLAKAILDAGNGVLFADDQQVASLVVHVWPVTKGADVTWIVVGRTVGEASKPPLGTVRSGARRAA